jgi:Phage terminase large subunit gpA, ATPase domain
VTRGADLIRRRVSMTTRSELRAKRDAAEREKLDVEFMPWALRVPEPKAALDFDRFPFQRELYEAGANQRELVVKKATQIGVSAWLVRWSMYHADTKGWTSLYVFPTASQLYDFSDARVKTLIDGSDYLSGRASRRDVQNKGLKRIGLGFVYFRGSEVKRALDSVDADTIAFDEYDTLTQENIPDAERRVSGSQHGLIRRVGVPSVPEFGVSGQYEASDKRRWMVKCGCGTWQHIDFWENVDQERVLVVCRQCRKPLDVGVGEWVAEFPERDIRGYHAPRLIVPRVATNENGALASIVKASKATRPYEVTTFHNKDLAEEYAPEEGRLTSAVLQAAQSAGGFYYMETGYGGVNLVTMGVDVASTRALNVRISEHLGDGVKRALWIGECDSFNEVAEKMREFRVNMACVDHLPEHRMAMGLANQFPGLVYLVNYSAPKDGAVMVVREETRTVSIRRTEAIDAMMAVMREQRNWLPVDLPEGYGGQMRALVRHATIDDVDKVVVGYKKTGPDDYAQAEVYDLVASEMWLYRQAVVAGAQRTEVVPLEDHLEFERSQVGDPSSMGYHAGPETGGFEMDALDLDEEDEAEDY